MTSPPIQTQVALIGAGTYGVSVGLALHARGIPFIQLGRPFELWMRHTLPGFSLRSDVRASGVYTEDRSRSLLGWVRATYPRATARRLEMRRLPGPVFRRYLRWVVDSLPYEVRPEYASSVDSSARSTGDAAAPGFQVVTAAGTHVEARQVVIATGIESHRHVPACVGALGADRVTHSWDAQALSALGDQRLLVVGGGQSAAEAAAFLAQRNRVTWIHRSALDFFAEPVGLPTAAYEVAAGLAGQLHRLPAPLRRAVSGKFADPTITPDLRRPLSRRIIRRVRSDAARVGLERDNGTVRSRALDEDYDHVVACTGYRFTLASLGFLSESLRAGIEARDDEPLLDAHFETSVPGLFAAGGLALHSHGAAQRFMIGSRHAAVRIGDAIGARGA